MINSWSARCHEQIVLDGLMVVVKPTESSITVRCRHWASRQFFFLKVGSHCTSIPDPPSPTLAASCISYRPWYLVIEFWCVMCLIALIECDTSDNFRIKITSVHKAAVTWTSAPLLWEHCRQQVYQHHIRSSWKWSTRADSCIDYLIHWRSLYLTRKGTQTIGRCGTSNLTGLLGNMLPSKCATDGRTGITDAWTWRSGLFLCRMQGPCSESDGHVLFGHPNGCKTLCTHQVTPASAGVVAVPQQ